MVRQGAAGALLFSFPFVDLFLINTGMRASAQTLCIISCRGATGFFAAFSTFFLAWYTLFSLAVYFGFFTTAAVGSFRFLFPLEADPEESVFLSFLPSWKSSSFHTALRTASSHSLSSGIGSIMDNRLTASFEI